MGTTSDLSLLSKRLLEIFAKRREGHDYARGTENRTDLTEWDRIERTIFVKADRSINLEPITKVIEAIHGAGANPVLLPIVVEGEKAEKLLDRLKPDPLTLVIGIG